MASIPISVVIIARNAEATLASCLSSVKEFNEVIVYVNDSSDNTLQIAKTFANTIAHEGSFKGFGETKNYAASLATNNWIFNLDADEILTPELTQEIAGLQLDKEAVYAIKRHNHYAGKLIKGCGWQNDIPVRIYCRDKTQYNDKKVHESVDTKGLTVTQLNGYFNHYPFDNISELLEKAHRYSSLYAQQHAGSKQSSVTRSCLSGMVSFFKSYIFQYGFIDGRAGFIISCFNSLGSFLKYLKLWELNKQKLDL